MMPLPGAMDAEVTQRRQEVLAAAEHNRLVANRGGLVPQLRPLMARALALVALLLGLRT
jgi:hypothetical protein